MRKMALIIASLLLPGYCISNEPPEAYINRGELDGEACGVGSTCQNLGGPVNYKVFNEGLKADDNDSLQAEATKVRHEDPKKLERTIEKMERMESMNE